MTVSIGWRSFCFTPSFLEAFGKEESMKVAVSSCLLGVACRYDGKTKPSEQVMRYLESIDAEVVRIRPEVLGGMSVPHPPCEIVEEQGCRRVLDSEGADHTEAFEAGALRALKRAEGCSRAILKAKSPSCGVGQVYDGTFSGALVAGDGMAAALFREAGIDLATERDFADGSAPW